MNEVANIPQLRFPEFGDNWEEKKLGSIGQTFNGLTGKTKDDFGRGKSYIQYMQIFESSKINIDNFGLVDVRDDDNQKVAQYGDVFFTTSSETPDAVGYSSVLLDDIDELYLNSFCFGFRPNSLDELSPNFAQFLLRSPNFRRRVVRLAQGSTRYNMSKVQLMEEVIGLPCLGEQTKIANFLAAVDTKIEQLSTKQVLLGEYKKGLMQQIFSQAISFKANDGSDFPDWEEKKLGVLTYKVGRKNKENIQYPIYSINNQEGFRPQSEQFDGLDSNDRGYDISLYKVVNEKTFAYNPARINVGSIGYSYNLNKVIISSLYVCFKTNDELENLYLLAYLDTDKFNKDILRYEEGGVRQYLFYENFSQISIPLPGNDEQAKISKFLSSIDTKIEQVGKQLDESKQFKKALLQQMFV